VHLPGVTSNAWEIIKSRFCNKARKR